eukprot:GEMP01044454.1.p1 GENE.GEMP01044454.1~~GEMP01044454.1.p1  ORF type:complete len:312 (+),score=50.27 GEMP01044454.1:99-1034(+)
MTFGKELLSKRLSGHDMSRFLWVEKDKELPDAVDEILYLRTTKCPFQDKCRHKDTGNCWHAHNFFELRRCPMSADGELLYSHTKCRSMALKEQACSAGAACRLAHTPAEVLYHPFVYRTKRCPNRDCTMLWCSFAHADCEIRHGRHLFRTVKPNKTMFCPTYPAPCDNCGCKFAHSQQELLAPRRAAIGKNDVDDDSDIRPPTADDDCQFRPQFSAKVCRMFFHFDKDNDGYLSKEVELPRFLKATGSQLSDDEYANLCSILRRTVTMTNPDLGFNLEEFSAVYHINPNFDYEEIIDSDYEAVFKGEPILH